jgi:hypothetical protein
MNWWRNAAQYATEVLAVVLIFRLLWLRDRRTVIYSVFVGFLAVQLAGALAFFACGRWGHDKIDYRIVWTFFTVALDFFCLWLVYSLAKAVLAELPGILRFSRILLYIVFPLAILIAFSTAPGEYWLTRARNFHDPVDRLMSIWIVADRGISMASVLILIAISAFILWFPVKMARNLAIFSVGLVIYFGSKTGLELLIIYSAPDAQTRSILSTCVSIVLIACFVYWIVFIDPKGQTAQVRLGHGWRLAEQDKLLGQLESINGVLMRSSQRMQL